MSFTNNNNVTTSVNTLFQLFSRLCCINRNACAINRLVKLCQQLNIEIDDLFFWIPRQGLSDIDRQRALECVTVFAIRPKLFDKCLISWSRFSPSNACHIDTHISILWQLFSLYYFSIDYIKPINKYNRSRTRQALEFCDILESYGRFRVACKIYANYSGYKVLQESCQFLYRVGMQDLCQLSRL